MNSYSQTPITNMAGGRTIRVGVADDHPVVRKGIVHELGYHADIEVLGEATNGDEALRLVHTLPLDVLVLDITMPGLPADEVVQQVVTGGTGLRVLILTAHWDLEHILSMLKAGAAGYMLKDEDPSIIATAVRAVARGETWMSSVVTAAVVNHTVREPVRSAEATLSVREREVLQELSSGKENQEIGATLHITERTVRFHLRNIYDKLGVRRGEAIARGVRMGLGERSEMETAFTE